MRKTEALEHAGRLWQMAKEDPGFSHDGEARRLTFALTMFAPSNYVAEKIGRVETTLEIWQSPRRWQQWGVENARANALIAVGNLRSAIETDWPDDA